MTASIRSLLGDWILLWLTLSTPLLGGPGELDPEFDAGRREAMSRELGITAGWVRGNGEVILARDRFDATPGHPSGLIRLLPDGRRDFSFAQDTNLSYVGTLSIVAALPGGPLLFGGEYKGLKPGTHGLLATTPRGKRDPAFVLDPTLETLRFTAMAVTSEGQVFLGSSSISYLDVTRPMSVVRIDPSGELDTRFRSALTSTGSVTTLRPLSGGGVLVAGRVAEPGSGAVRTLVRLLADGTVDASFEEPAQLAGRVILGGIDLPDGDWIIWTAEPPERSATSLIRLRGDGTAAPGHETWEGRPGMTTIRAVIPDGDGFLVGGSQLVRLGADGRPDSSAVLPQLLDPGDSISVLLRLPDQSVVAGGSFVRVQSPGQGPIFRPSFLRFTSGDGVDVNFGRTGLTQDIRGEQSPERIEVVPLQDGGVVTFGSERHANGLATGSIDRWGPQGALDTHFSPNRIRTSGVTGIAELPGGRWLVSFRSAFSLDEMPPAPLLILDSAGQVTPLTKVQGTVDALAPSSNGSVLVVGSFDPLQTRGVPELRRITVQGTLDAGFAPDLGFAPSVARPGMLLAVHSDGRIVVGVKRTGEIRRFLADGSVDPQFEMTPPIEESAERLQSLVVLDDNSIMAAGGSLKTSAGEHTIVIRWKPDGTRDRSFRSALGGQPAKVAAADSGRFLISGQLYTSNHLSEGLFRCLPNGDIDPSFQPPSNLTALNGLASQGRWAYVLASLRYRISSLQGDVALVRFDNEVRPLANPEPTPAGVRLHLVAPSGEAHLVEASDDLKSWTPVGAFVMPTNHQVDWMLPARLSGPNQFYRDTRLE